jgi:hypothetical protein
MAQEEKKKVKQNIFFWPTTHKKTRGHKEAL